MRVIESWKARAVWHRLTELSGGQTRFVDMGVRLYVVKQSQAGGVELVPNKPPVESIRVHDFGGIWDTALSRFVGPSKAPVRWACSEAQCELIAHGPHLAPKILCYGSEGAGKTELLAMYAIIMALRYAERGVFGYAGATAPTNQRLHTLENKIRSRIPTTWYGWLSSRNELALHCNIAFQLRATLRHSAAVGSPVQGFDWLFCVSDEIQDSIEADPDIETRGRAAPGGVYRRLATCTAKDTSDWRTFRDERKRSPVWCLKRLEGPSNPFVAPEHWDNLKLSLSKRDYQRRVLAMDVAPERALYPNFDRAKHLRPLPRVGAVDVTRQLLNRGDGEYSMLIGHDPGESVDASILLKAYQMPDSDWPVWFAVGEVVTERTTTERHVRHLEHVLQREWGLQYAGGPRALVRYDPHIGIGGDRDREKGISVPVAFKNGGFRALAGNYKDGRPYRIAREDRIELVNVLLENARGDVRLYIATDERATPLCPALVESLEFQERDLLGRAEIKVRHGKDITHYACALGYGLFAIERPRLVRHATQQKSAS